MLVAKASDEERIADLEQEVDKLKAQLQLLKGSSGLGFYAPKENHLSRLVTQGEHAGTYIPPIVEVDGGRTARDLIKLVEGEETK